MSVQAFLEHQRKIIDLAAAAPSCWAIVANSVHARAEQKAIVAVFDTPELAEAYVEASLLPDDMPPEERRIDDRYRSFRPDSLLWDYNVGFEHLVVELKSPLVAITMEGGWNGFNGPPPPQNPAPPYGPLPPGVFARDAAKRLGADAETAALIE